MLEVKRILVPIDSSDISEHAMQEAANLNTLFGAEIHVLYVADINKLAINAYLSGNILLEISKAGEKILSKADQFFTEDNLTKVYRTGDPAEVILGYAEDIEPDYIIIGSRGLGWVKGVLLGSVSKSVIEHSKCPVIVVK